MVFWFVFLLSSRRDWRMERLRNSRVSLWRTVWRFLKKLKIELPHDTTIPLLDIYPDKTIIQKDTCTPMFIAALFTRAKTWKQPKCPSTDEWTKKKWSMYTMHTSHGKQ